MTISASEIKKRGVSIFDKFLDEFSEIVINVRGKNKYLVIPFEDYEDYRKYKLEKAYQEVKKDIEEGRFEKITTDEELDKYFEELKKCIV
jgi:PHD/YefM family antitoxin component YafN of YafNO toxin-antitoxin module